ncbi:bifunctional diguanylate cyclase/phosphodiesterase [Aureimonas sp. SK2]|uniref:putative bifunctional diguanylate cyclase/phosphodiesterase n=1 Tax=Aureimonas sp. SK2 TaxID=3015992 RepID=UPI002444F417|nr:bifunctional diguanylate cyclase/phosphodiesterase [Aureimonas sp. SK2]
MTALARLPLPSRFARVRFGLLTVTALLAAGVLIASVLAAGYLNRIDEASRYNRTFDAGQTLAELLRLQIAFATANEATGIDGLRLRADIFKNRVSLLGSGTFPHPEMKGELYPRLVEAERQITTLLGEMPSDAAAAKAVAVLEPLVQPLARMTSRSHAMAGDNVAQTQTRLRNIFGALTGVTLILLLFGAALIAFVLRQNNRLDRTLRTDSLTGLANRLAFGTYLERQRIDRSRSMILVDVANFKALNDLHGHDFGDKVLRGIADCLSAAAPDASLIARIGGDEFAVLFEGVYARQRSLAACARIEEDMSRPVMADCGHIHVSVTIGFRALKASDAAHTAEMFLKEADLALHEGKSAGRGGVTEFRPAMMQAFLDRRRLQSELRGSAERGETYLEFQPVVDLRTHRTLGFEALLRWEHPELGLISPATFIPLAEESGLIQDMGRWVLSRAIEEAASWNADIFVAVNVSARQLADRGLVAFIAQALAAHRLPSERLEIEITETALVDNDGVAIETLQGLRALGCRIALDDFGTGYASLSYLQRFPFDKLKIDRSFVEGCRIDKNSSAIIAAVCDLASRLRLGIVAEGIETAEHRDFVAQAGCGLGQGYLFDRPLPVARVLERLAREASQPAGLSPTIANEAFRAECVA